MSHKKRNFITAEVCIERPFQDPERAHLLEHVRFLEDRTSDLETKVEILRDMFAMVLELDKEEESEIDEEDFLASIGCCLWDDDEDNDEDEEGD